MYENNGDHAFDAESRAAARAAHEEAVNKAKEWGMTPGRVTTLVKALVRVADEWGSEAKDFR